MLIYVLCVIVGVGIGVVASHFIAARSKVTVAHLEGWQIRLKAAITQDANLLKNEVMLIIHEIEAKL